MKIKIIGLAAVIIAIILIIAAACSNSVIPSEPQPSAATASSSLPPLVHSSPILSYPPEVTYTVKTDYSQLTPYQPPEEIYTRLSDDFLPELVPSEDYGILVPYVGERVYSQWWGDFNYYGLMTTDGMIVTDAVYAGIYRQSDFYILDQPADHEHRYARCALDGSWVTPFDSEEIFCCDQVILLVRDSSKNDIDVLDYSGKLLYNTRSIDTIAQLPPHTIYNPNDEMSFNWLEYGDGYITVFNVSDYEDVPTGLCFYIEELTGKVVYTDYSTIRGFRGGLAAVEQDGRWGYIDTSFNYVIEPVYDYAFDFEDGKAIVRLTGENAVIDASGNILLKTKGELTNFSCYFIEKNTDSHKTVIYDDNLNAVFKADDDDILSTFTFNGLPAYSYLKSGKTTIVTKDFTTVISGSYEINQMNEAFIYCRIAGKDDNDLILKPDGTLMVKLKPDTDVFTNVTIVNQDYLIVNHYQYYEDYSAYGDTYLVLDKSGNAVFTGVGGIGYDARTGLFDITTETYYTVMDASGKVIFRLSLLDNIPD